MTSAGTPAELALERASSQLTAVGLDELVARGALQTRTDRKYFVPAAVFEQVAAELAPDHQVLDIDGQRLFAYLTAYFDTAELLTYRAHLQRRRKRYKIWTRTYLDSSDCMLELKLAGRRAGVIKLRRPHPSADRARLSAEDHSYLAHLLGEEYDVSLPGRLEVVLTTSYRRATYASRAELTRLTCDVGLLCQGGDSGDQRLRARDDYVLVETKSPGPGSRADRVLRLHGVRPATISKYCLGVAALHPELPSNPWHPTLRRYFDWSPDVWVVGADSPAQAP